VRIFSQNLNLLTAAKVVNRHTAYMDSLDEIVKNERHPHELFGQANSGLAPLFASALRSC